jgi:glutaredoxin
MLVGLVGIFVFQWPEIIYYNNPAKRISAQNKGVAVLYSTADCIYCAQIKEIFDDKNFSYVEYDIDENPKARNDLYELGGKGVPLLLVDGEVIPGFNPDKVLQLTQAAAVPG